MRARRKGVAIVDSKRGILVVAGRSKVFTLPGGGVQKGESSREAAKRELHEETGLRANKVRYLFHYIGNGWRSKNGMMRNHTKVFLVKEKGVARTRNEIKYVDYWRPEKRIRMSEGTKKVIELYLAKCKKKS